VPIADRPTRRPEPHHDETAPDWKKEQSQNACILRFGLHEPFDRADGREQADRAAGKTQEQDDELLRDHGLIRQHIASPDGEARRRSFSQNREGLAAAGVNGLNSK